MNGKRILNVMLAAGQGGLETMGARYHAALRAGGAEVLSVGAPDGWMAQALAASGHAFTPLKARFGGDPLAAIQLKALAKTFQADLVIAHGNRAISLGASPLSGLAHKTVAVAHNFRAKGSMGGIRAALCVSAAVEAAIKARFPQLETRRMENFGPLAVYPVKPSPTAKPGGIPTPPVIGSLGRLHRNKGFDVLLDAAALLKARTEGEDHQVTFSLNLAGDGPERAALEARAEQLGLGGIVHFVGWTQDPGRYLQGLDLFLLPSRVEPFGLVVAEAMAAGVPVISSDIDGPRDILMGGDLGLLVRPEDPEALCDAMQTVFADWDLALRRAREAQDAAIARYSPEQGQARLCAVLDGLV